MKPAFLRWMRLALLLAVCFGSASCPPKMLPGRFYFAETRRPDDVLAKPRPTPEPAPVQPLEDRDR